MQDLGFRQQPQALGSHRSNHTYSIDCDGTFGSVCDVIDVLIANHVPDRATVKLLERRVDVEWQVDETTLPPIRDEAT